MLCLLGLQRLLAIQTVFYILDTLESNSQVFVELSSIWVCWQFALIARKLYMCHHMINEGHLSRGTYFFFFSACKTTYFDLYIVYSLEASHQVQLTLRDEVRLHLQYLYSHWELYYLTLLFQLPVFILLISPP